MYLPLSMCYSPVITCNSLWANMMPGSAEGLKTELVALYNWIHELRYENKFIFLFFYILRLTKKLSSLWIDHIIADIVYALIWIQRIELVYHYHKLTVKRHSAEIIKNIYTLVGFLLNGSEDRYHSDIYMVKIMLHTMRKR